MKIEILGMGCPSCEKLEKNTEDAVRSAGLEAEIVKVSDMNAIMDYGVTRTPALVIDGVVKSSGEVLNTSKIFEIINRV